MMWGKSSMFQREAGAVILGCSIALWALHYFPRGLPKSAPDYAAGNDADEHSQPLRQALRTAKTSEGKTAYPPLGGLSLMVFFALAMQCMSTLAVVRRESGGIAWPLFLFGYMTVLAWVVCFAVYQGGCLLGFG